MAEDFCWSCYQQKKNVNWTKEEYRGGTAALYLRYLQGDRGRLGS